MVYLLDINVLLVSTLSLPSKVRERLNPLFLVPDLIALMAPVFTSILACSVAVAVSTAGWSDIAKEERKEIKKCKDSGLMHTECFFFPPLDTLASGKEKVVF